MVGQIDHFLKTGELLPLPSLKQRLDCAKEHLIGLWEYKGQRGIFQSRKHLSWYCQGFKGASKLRDECSHINTVEEGLNLLDKAIVKGTM